jgi:uncharacterized protein (TIGR02145 family)
MEFLDAVYKGRVHPVEMDPWEPETNAKSFNPSIEFASSVSDSQGEIPVLEFRSGRRFNSLSMPGLRSKLESLGTANSVNFPGGESDLLKSGISHFIQDTSQSIKGKPGMDLDFRTVRIGAQTWMTDNLSVQFFRNGDPIPEAQTISEWLEAGVNRQPAWCHYENEEGYGIRYGKLYNWYAVIDPRNIAPAGFHIPSTYEWTLLLKYIEKSSGKDVLHSLYEWSSEDFSFDSYGFGVLPSGMRNHKGEFVNRLKGGYFWTSTEMDQIFAFAREFGVNAGNNASSEFGTNKIVGFSIRCIKN